MNPGNVYSCLKEIIAKDEEKDKPKYEVNPRDGEGNQNKFENIEEASSHWKSLWESEGTGNTEANWLDEVRAAIDECVPAEIEVGESEVITSLKEGTSYKFLGVTENVKQEDSQVLKCAAKIYLQRMSVIWSSPLSDFNKVMASNQFALPILSYLMWSQVWPIAELQRLDRETRKVIVKHPLGSTLLMYLPRKSGGRGLKSVESEYKLMKIKAAVKL